MHASQPWWEEMKILVGDAAAATNWLFFPKLWASQVYFCALSPPESSPMVTNCNPICCIPSQVPSHSWWLIPQVLSDLHISWHFSTCSSSPLWFFCSSQPVPDVTLCEGSAMVGSTTGDMSEWAWQSWNLERNSAVATRDHKFCRTRPSSLRKGGKTSYHIVLIFLTMKLR